MTHRSGSRRITSVGTTCSAITIVRALAFTCSGESHFGPIIQAFPSSSQVWTWTTATSGNRGFSVSHRSPEKGSLTKAISDPVPLLELAQEAGPGKRPYRNKRYTQRTGQVAECNRKAAVFFGLERAGFDPGIDARKPAETVERSASVNQALDGTAPYQKIRIHGADALRYRQLFDALADNFARKGHGASGNSKARKRHMGPGGNGSDRFTQAGQFFHWLTLT